MDLVCEFIGLCLRQTDSGHPYEGFRHIPHHVHSWARPIRDIRGAVCIDAVHNACYRLRAWLKVYLESAKPFLLRLQMPCHTCAPLFPIPSLCGPSPPRLPPMPSVPALSHTSSAALLRLFSACPLAGGLVYVLLHGLDPIRHKLWSNVAQQLAPFFTVLHFSLFRLRHPSHQ